MLMRFSLALAAILALLGTSGPAAAAFRIPTYTLQLTLDAPVFQGGVWVYGGTLTNTGTGPLTVDGDSLALPSEIGATDIFTDLVLGPLPLSLNAGQSYAVSDFFELAIPSGFGGGVGDFLATFAAANGTQGVSNLVEFPVPEPATLLLVAGAMAGLGAMRRRA